VVGYSTNNVDSRPFIWTAQSGMVDLNSLLPPNAGWALEDATDINDSGQVTGSGQLGGDLRAYRLTLPAGAGYASIVDLGTSADAS
jgi:hypothetical protein